MLLQVADEEDVTQIASLCASFRERGVDLTRVRDAMGRTTLHAGLQQVVAQELRHMVEESDFSYGIANAPPSEEAGGNGAGGGSASNPRGIAGCLMAQGAALDTRGRIFDLDYPCDGWRLWRYRSHVTWSSPASELVFLLEQC